MLLTIYFQVILFRAKTKIIVYQSLPKFSNKNGFYHLNKIIRRTKQNKKERKTRTKNKK